MHQNSSSCTIYSSCTAHMHHVALDQLLRLGRRVQAVSAGGGQHGLSPNTMALITSDLWLNGLTCCGLVGES